MAAGVAPARAPPKGARKPVRSGAEALQRRMKVGAASDRFEREADRIADHVVGPSALPAAAPPPVISPIGVQRMALDEPEVGPEEPAQRAARPTGPEEKKEEPALPVQRAEASALPPTPTTEEEPKTESAAPVQRKARAAGPEEPAEEVQKKSATIQRMRAAGPEEPDKKTDLAEALQTKEAAPSGAPGVEGGAAPAEVEAAIRRMKGGAAPGLDDATRAQMEERMGVDLSGVRVHTGTDAGKAADGLNAKAFTVGQDMFFGSGQFDSGSSKGQHLIAHEAAHTVQQRGGTAGVQRIQRATSGGPPAAKNVTKLPDPDDTKTYDWEIDFTAQGGGVGKVQIPKLKLPIVASAYKGASGGEAVPKHDSGQNALPSASGLKLNPVPRRPDGKAFETWYKHAKSTYAGKAKTEIEGMIASQGNAGKLGDAANPTYVLYYKKKKAETSNALIVGTPQELSEHDSILRPQISRSGAPKSLDADHILELQIGGEDSAANMWLLESKYNRKIGPQIKGSTKKSIDDVLKDARDYLKKNPTLKTPKPIPGSADTVKLGWVMDYKGLAKDFGTSYTYWTKAEIAEGKQIEHFKALTEDELFEQGFKFKEGKVPTHINVFPVPTGGRAIRFDVLKGGAGLKIPSYFYSGIKITKIVIFTLPTADTNEQTISQLEVTYTKRFKGESEKKTSEPKIIDLKHATKLGFGAYISRESITAKFSKDDFPGMSPISFPNPRITSDGVFFAEGHIAATKALFPGLQVPIIRKGEEISISFPIPTDKLKFGPVQVTDASLAVGYGAEGLFMSGEAGISVDKVGSGMLMAKATKDDVVISGKFAFDFTFVENAELDAEYSLKKDDFKIKGTLGVKKGGLPGVEGGTIEIDVTRNSFGITGALNLGGVLAGSTITVGYTPETGFLIEGKDLPLPVEKLPGVSDAKITVRAQRSPDTGEWAISGAGSAALKAPGTSGTLSVSMNGEAIKFDGRIDLAKGPASGFIQITATNMAMDDQGNPVEGSPVGELQIWGKGSATIAFGKVLTGTAGIEYTREGKIIITGEIALPPTVDLFKKVEYNKQLLHIEPPDFPIWGVKLGPVGIGIFAFVDAKLDFLAYVGPGQLRDTKVNATMDLDKPSEAKVEGKAKFHVPAYAGFRLDVGGGLKAQVAVAYVKGRVGLDGTLGLGAEASIDVGVKWNAQDGFSADALAEIKASPKFELGVNASVSAGVSLPWPLSDIEKTWGPWRKKLGEFGPNMELSAKFPVKYTEKDGLDLDLNKIQVTKPSLDAKALMKSTFDTLV